MAPELREYYGVSYGWARESIPAHRPCRCSICGDDFAIGAKVFELPDGSLLDMLCWAQAVADTVEAADGPTGNDSDLDWLHYLTDAELIRLTDN